MYVAGLVAYDGTGYCGFQIQRNEPTIQSVLEDALAACTFQQERVHGSGRTDSGVHASGQVIATNVVWNHSAADLQNAWNAFLPKSVAIRQLVEAPVAFHPRFSAEKRTYRYTLFDSDPADYSAELGEVQARPPRSSPLVEHFALYVPQRLNLPAMQAAAKYLVGEHDFLTFGQAPQGENTVRRIYDATWQHVTTTLPQLHNYPGRQLTFTITANAFLRHMVRNIVGTLLNVGKELWEPSEVLRLIKVRDRGHCAPPAPPNGLVLEHVAYPALLDPWNCPAR